MEKMIRLFIWIGILPIFCSASFAHDFDSLNDCSSFEVFVPNIDSGFEITGSALFLRPSAGNLGWGVVTDFLPFVTSTWHIKTLKPRYQAAFNVGACYTCPCSGIDFQLNWTHLRTHDSQSVSVTPILQWVSPFCQTGPGTGNTTYDPTGVGQLTEAHASVKFHYDVMNWDVGTFINIGPQMCLRAFVGLSGVRIKEELSSTFEHVSGLPIISLNNNSRYIGIGPRLGFSSSYKLCRGFDFVGQFAGALLFGNMQPAQYRFAASSPALAAVGISTNRGKVSSSSVSHTVPSLDAKLGLSYACDFCECYILAIEVGYMGAIYINPLSGYETNTNVLPLELGSLSTNSMKHIQSDFSVHGPYLTLSLKF